MSSTNSVVSDTGPLCFFSGFVLSMHLLDASANTLPCLISHTAPRDLNASTHARSTAGSVFAGNLNET